jgi:hypothetical protein
MSDLRLNTIRFAAQDILFVAAIAASAAAARWEKR